MKDMRDAAGHAAYPSPTRHTPARRVRRMESLYVERAAARMRRRFAAESSALALQRADALLEQGDGEGFQLWLRVAEIIDAEICAAETEI